MQKLLIFGIGKSAEVVQENLLNDNTSILGYIDNNKLKQGQYYKECPIIAPNQVSEYCFDYIIIATLYYESVIIQLLSLGVNSTKIIAFFSDECIGCKEFANIINLDNWKYEVLRYEMQVALKKNEKVLNLYLNNLEYEIANKLIANKYIFPIIKSEDEAIKKIIEDKCSISRFGDGEFEMMIEKERPKFQQPDSLLAKRLKEIINSNLDNHIVAIADNYGSLDKYDADVAMDIREYMSSDVREYHLKILDKEKIYYNAYLSRPYMIYKDKDKAEQKFETLMEIWDNRDILIIEGEKTRFGVGNNLLNKVKSIKRILAPSENAFSKYDAILNEAVKIEKETLILIALGPTATVLAYDLAIIGYQAIDIGHLDIEYEWFLEGKGKKTIIKYKYVNEVLSGDMVEDINDGCYYNQIIARVIY